MIIEKLILKNGGTRFKVNFGDEEVILELKENGFSEEGIHTLMAKETFKQTKIALSNAVSKHIQSKIEEYNDANGTDFKGIDALPKYTRKPTYAHINFVNATLDWNIDVWEHARKMEIEVMQGIRAVPPESELIRELPVLSYPK